jgi:hypothetical protein
MFSKIVTIAVAGAVLLAITSISCSLPFDTDTTNPETVFQVTADYDAQFRLVNSMPVSLSWNDITIDDYKLTRITRYNQHRDPASYPLNAADNGWVTIAELSDSFQTSYTDSISDDAVFTYRVDLVDGSDNYKRAETDVTIRPTTHLIIPDDRDSVKTTVESYIIDDGDSVLIRPGEYLTNAFSFFDRDISLIGIGGAYETFLIWIERTALVEVLNDSTFIDMSQGLIEGFTVLGGSVNRGGGIRAQGDAVVQQCVIKGNLARQEQLAESGGQGGGIYASGSAIIQNCILYNNVATHGGSGIYVDTQAQDVRIINCTLLNNNIRIDSPFATVLNCIAAGPQIASEMITVFSSERPSIRYSLVGYSWTNIDDTNIIGHPWFVAPPSNVRLGPLSPCIDSGDPSVEYFDSDGSRNDMGAYGGPMGNW